MGLIQIFSLNHKVFSLCCSNIKHWSSIVSFSDNNSMYLMQLVQSHPFSMNPKVSHSLSSSFVLQPLTRFPRYGRKGASKCRINLVLSISGHRAVIRQRKPGKHVLQERIKKAWIYCVYGVQEAYISWRSATVCTQNVSLELIKLNWHVKSNTVTSSQEPLIKMLSRIKN